MLRRGHQRLPVERPWLLIAFVTLALVGLTVRLSQLSARPIGFDEGVHAFYSLKMAEGYYTHEPWKHGPLIYYLGGLLYRVVDPTVLAGRALVATISAIAIPALYLLRDDFPDVSLVAVGTILAVHPWAVYAGRIYRSDALLAAFVLAGFCLFHYHRRTGTRWSAWAFGFAVIGATASKEVAYLLVVLLAIPPLVVAHMAVRFSERSTRDIIHTHLPIRHLDAVVGAVVLGYIVFYSNYPPELIDLVAPYHVPLIGEVYHRIPLIHNISDSILWWVGEAGGGSGDPFYFIGGLVRESPVLTGLAVVGTAGTLLRPSTSWVRWHTLWWGASLGTILSLLGHQSPWTGIHVLLPVAFVAAGGVDDVRVLLHRHLPDLTRRLERGRATADGGRVDTRRIVQGVALIVVVLAAVAPASAGASQTLSAPTDTGAEAALPKVLADVSVQSSADCPVYWDNAFEWPGKWVVHDAPNQQVHRWGEFSYTGGYVVAAQNYPVMQNATNATHTVRDGIHVYQPPNGC